MQNLDETGLVWEADEKSGPGMHALIVGVGRYPFAANPPALADLKDFKHQDLDAPSLTALAIARFLIGRKNRLAAPLHSLRLLASPTQVELEAEPSLSGLLPATHANVRRAVRAWQADASLRSDGAATFYFGGHGIQRAKTEAVLLLEDFLDPEGNILERCIDVNDLYNGMAPSELLPNMASTQFYFIDACRVDAEGLRKLATRGATPALIDSFTGLKDQRIAPKYFAAAPGAQTFCMRGDLTLFGRDLLDCLANDAADKVRVGGQSTYAVTIDGLVRAMSRRKNAWNRQHARNPKFERSFDADNWTDLEAPIHVLDKPPRVRCRFTLTPKAAVNYGELRCHVTDTRGQLVAVTGFPLFPVQPHPHECELEMGGYMIEARVNEGEAARLASLEGVRPITAIATVMPPEYEHEFQLQ